MAVALPLLSGTLPSSVPQPNTALRDLMIAGTLLSGTLPESLRAMLPALEVLDVRANNLHGIWPRELSVAKVSTCFNRQEALRGHPCDYPTGLCDAKDPTPLEAGAALRWYRKTNDQCAACGERSLLWFSLMLVGFSVLAPAWG